MNVPLFYCVVFQTPISTNITKLTGEFKLHTLKKVTRSVIIKLNTIYMIINTLLKDIQEIDRIFSSNRVNKNANSKI